MTAQSICGSYVGQKRVREGREDELSPGERKELARGRPHLELKISPNGKFESEIVHGKWRLEGERLICTPSTFGGQTFDEMKRRAEEMGRAFSLAFLFRPFELLVRPGSLVTADEEALIFTEYRPVAP